MYMGEGAERKLSSSPMKHKGRSKSQWGRNTDMMKYLIKEGKSQARSGAGEGESHIPIWTRHLSKAGVDNNLAGDGI